MRALRNLSLVVLSVAISIGLAELAVRLFVPLRDVGPSFSVPDPVLGKRLKRSFSGERITPEFRMRLSTNSLGFRGPEPEAFPRDAILFLGDSFTMGYGVNDGEEFPALVGAALRQRYGSAAPPIVNAAIGDSGNGYWLKFLQRDALAIQPRVVVMEVLYNDFTDNLRERLFALGPAGDLRELPLAKPGAVRAAWDLLEATGVSSWHIAGLLRQALAPKPVDADWLLDSAVGPSDELTFRIVEASLRVCQTQGWRTIGVLVSLPREHEAAMKALFVRYAAPVVTLPAKNARPDLYYRVDGHWNARGQAYAAERVLGAMASLGIDLPAPAANASPSKNARASKGELANWPAERGHRVRLRRADVL